MSEGHLLDDLAAAFGTFDVFHPHEVAAPRFFLEFWAELFEPRRAEIEEVMLRVAGPEGIVVGLAFFGPAPAGRPPQDVFRLLAQHELGDENAWSCTSHVLDEDDSVGCWFFSRPTKLGRNAARALSEIVVRHDFGTWEGVAAAVYLWIPHHAALARFWDDRGADVVCESARVLAAYRKALGRYVSRGREETRR